jgi:hypothetical protein
MANPNAFAAALTNALVWLLGVALKHWNVIDLSPTQELAIAGGATTVVLWVGRVGILGAIHRILHGAEAVIAGPTNSQAPRGPAA